MHRGEAGVESAFRPGCLEPKRGGGGTVRMRGFELGATRACNQMGTPGEVRSPGGGVVHPTEVGC